jgi:hypothetical protein
LERLKEGAGGTRRGRCGTREDREGETKGSERGRHHGALGIPSVLFLDSNQFKIIVKLKINRAKGKYILFA